MQRLNIKTIILLLFIPIKIMGQNNSEEEVILNEGRSARLGFGGLELLRDVWKQFCNRTCWGFGEKIFIISRRLLCAIKCPESANPNRPNQGSTTTASPESTTTQSTTAASTVSKYTTTESTTTQSTTGSTTTQSTTGFTTTKSTTKSKTLPSSTLPQLSSTSSAPDKSTVTSNQAVPTITSDDEQDLGSNPGERKRTETQVIVKTKSE